MLDNSSADPSDDDEEFWDADEAFWELPDPSWEVGSDGGAGSSQQRRSHSRTGTWGERIDAAQAAWDAGRPARTEEMRLAAARLQESVSRKQDSIRDGMHTDIERAAHSHSCCQDAGASLERVGDPRKVTYLEMGHAVHIKVPTVQCSLCRVKWEVSACAVHCFPSSPVVAQVWVDVQLLQLFHHCTMKGGLSATAFAAALATVRAATEVLPVHYSAR